MVRNILRNTWDYISSALLKSRNAGHGGQVVVHEPPLRLKLEYYLQKVQDTVLWVEPVNSVIAFILVHIIYTYLAWTSNTPLNLFLWGVIVMFIYTTWIQCIWPEIRVEEEPLTADGELNPWVPRTAASGPKVVCSLVDSAVAEMLRWWAMRQESKGKFCVLATLFFGTLAYFGSSVTLLGLFYYTCVGSLVLSRPFLQIYHYPIGVEHSDHTVSRPLFTLWSYVGTFGASLTSKLPDITYLENKYQQLSEQLLSDVDNVDNIPDVDELLNEVLETCDYEESADQEMPGHEDNMDSGLDVLIPQNSTRRRQDSSIDLLKSSSHPALKDYHNLVDDEDTNREFMPMLGGDIPTESESTNDSDFELLSPEMSDEHD